MLGLCRLTPCIGVNGGIVSSEGGKFLWLVHQPFRGADLAGTLSIVQLLWLFWDLLRNVCGLFWVSLSKFSPDELNFLLSLGAPWCLLESPASL